MGSAPMVAPWLGIGKNCVFDRSRSLQLRWQSSLSGMCFCVSFRGFVFGQYVLNEMTFGLDMWLAGPHTSSRPSSKIKITAWNIPAVQFDCDLLLSLTFSFWPWSCSTSYLWRRHRATFLSILGIQLESLTHLAGTKRRTEYNPRVLIITESYRRLPKATESYQNLPKASPLVACED